MGFSKKIADVFSSWDLVHGFTFHDVGSTTDLLTQIDQICSNFDLGEPTQTLDSYYSDHKPLLLSLPYVPLLSQEF